MKRFAKLTALCIVMTLVAALFCLPAQAETKTIISSGSVGTGSGKQTTLVDFTASDLCGFEVVGNTSEPTFKSSTAWNANVLYTWLNSAESETGIRGTIEKTSSLAGASTLSVSLLAQYKKAENHAVTLRLVGVDKAGAPLALEAVVSAPSAGWQTITFDISSFVASANPDAPCTVTVLTSSDAESEEFVLWVHSLYTSSLEDYSEILIPAVCAAGGLVVGFVLFFVIYRATCKKNRRRHGEVR